MAVTIDDLHVETKDASAAGAQKEQDGGKSPSKCDLQSAMERLKERESRLRAD